MSTNPVLHRDFSAFLTKNSVQKQTKGTNKNAVYLGFFYIDKGRFGVVE